MCFPGLKMKFALVLVLGGLFAASPVFADKPAWAGSGKGGKNANSEPGGGQRDDDARSRRDKDGASSGQRQHFDAQHRVYVRDYYAKQSSGGRCPPGLAKKNNGCMPPGQAKKWVTGQPLPAGVVTYPVPQPLLVQLGTPPAGYRYVRVGNDIVLLSPGTSAVVDVIRNLGRG